MPECGKNGNPKPGFPFFPRLLGNLANGARFPHSHRSGCCWIEGRSEKTKLKCGPWKSGNQKAVPTFPPPRQPPAGRKKYKKRGTHLSTQERGLLKRLDRPDHSTGLEGPAQANYQHPGWAKSDDQSGPGRMIKLIFLGNTKSMSQNTSWGRWKSLMLRQTAYHYGAKYAM
jgi:hypothetical protein